MSSQASWQTSGAGTRSTGWGDSNTDRQSIDSLLRRLVQQVEETERRYGDALDELQARLDRLAHKTETAKGASDTPAFGRLHDQVSGLAQQFGHNASAPLNDFERLGRAVMDSLDAGGASPPAAEPAPGPAFTSPPPFATAPERPVSAPAPSAEPPFTFSPLSPQGEADRDLSRRLVEMAHRLEHSVEETMTPKAVDVLSARIDALGREITHAVKAPKPVSLEPLEQQVFDIANQLRQAEGQLARIGDVETSLHRLIERVDLHANDLSDVAAKAATEAARLVSKEAKLDAATVERLDHMHRDLKEMSARSSAADNRLAGLVESVHDSLKQLVQQVERGTKATEAKPVAPFVERMSGGTAERQKTAPSQSRGPSQSSATQPSPKSDLRTPLLGGEKLAGGSAVDLDQDKPADPDAPRTSRILPRKAGTESETESDLVAEARRAAKAAALKAAERTGAPKHQWTPSGTEARPRTTTITVEAPARRGWSLLIVFAAVLLALSAALLYGRLQPQPWLKFFQPAAEKSAPADSTPSPSAPVPGPGKSAHAVAPASLRPDEAPALPPGVVLWVEEPAPSL